MAKEQPSQQKQQPGQFQQKQKLGQLRCNECGQSFDSQDQLREHESDCSGRKPGQI